MLLYDFFPGVQFIIGTPEARRAQAQDAALQELANCHQRVMEQRSVVASKDEAWKSRCESLQSAQNAFQLVGGEYTLALAEKSEKSDALKVRFLVREHEVKQCLESVRDARKDLDNALQQLRALENIKLAAAQKLNALCGRASVLSATASKNPVVSTQLTVAQEFEQFRQQAKNASDSALGEKGKVKPSGNVMAHFAGKKNEHVESEQTLEVRADLERLKNTSKFASLKEKIGGSLRLRIALPPDERPENSGQVNPRLKIKLQRAFAFEQDPEEMGHTRLPFLVSLQAKLNRPAAFEDLPEVKAMHFPDLVEKSRKGSLTGVQVNATRPTEQGILRGEINEAIRKRRITGGF